MPYKTQPNLNMNIAWPGNNWSPGTSTNQPHNHPSQKTLNEGPSVNKMTQACDKLCPSPSQQSIGIWCCCVLKIIDRQGWKE